jgi:hypothetical protein
VTRRNSVNIVSATIPDQDVVVNDCRKSAIKSLIQLALDIKYNKQLIREILLQYTACQSTIRGSNMCIHVKRGPWSAQACISRQVESLFNAALLALSIESSSPTEFQRVFFFIVVKDLAYTVSSSGSSGDPFCGLRGRTCSLRFPVHRRETGKREIYLE